MFPDRLGIDDVATFDLFRAKEIDKFSQEEKDEYIAALHQAIKELQDELEYVENQ